MCASTIFIGGRVYTGDPGRPPETCLAVADGRVAAVGDETAVRAIQRPDTRVIDLDGRAVVPGLTDAHLHILGYALSLDQLQLAGVRSLAEIRAAVAEAAGRRAPGEWITGRGWDQDQLAERRLPTKHDLDEVSPHHPVFVQRNCNHIAVVNSAALRAAGIGRDTADPPGGRIDRDPVTGEPIGILREKAMDLVTRLIPPPTPARRRELLARALREALQHGLTQLQTDDCQYAGGLGPTEALFRELIGPEAIPIRIIQAIPAADVAEAAERGIRTGRGDQWYRWGHVKIFADGSLGGRTAALLEPYADDPSTGGIYIHERDDLIEQVAEAHRLGNQVGCHAIGDGAAALFLDAVAESQRRHPRPDARHRMIHCQILSEPLMVRMAALGVVGDIQPVFLRSDGHWFVDRVGPERAATSYSWRSMQQHGIALCGGSDCPIEPLNPWYGVHLAVHRQDLTGFPPGGWQPAQRLTVAEAMRLYTAGPAYAAFEEAFRGRLVPGMAADLAVLDRDPFTCDPAELKDIRSALTMVGGVIGYEA